MANALGQNASFHGNGGPALKKLVEEAFGAGMSFENPGNSNFGVALDDSIVLSNGDRTVRIVNPPSPSREQLQTIRDKPLVRRQDGVSTPGTTPKRLYDSYHPIPLDALHIKCLGASAADLVWRWEALSVGAEMIHKIAMEAVGRARAAEHRIREKLGLTAESIEKGTSTSNLDPKVRQQLLDQLSLSFKMFGFSSEEEAQAFFAGATVQSHTRSITLLGASGMGIFGFSLTPP
jgi:hypothetical protein